MEKEEKRLNKWIKGTEVHPFQQRAPWSAFDALCLRSKLRWEDLAILLNIHISTLRRWRKSTEYHPTKVAIATLENYISKRERRTHVMDRNRH